MFLRGPYKATAPQEPMYLFRYGALTYLMQTVPGKPASKLNPKAVSFTSEKSLKRAR